MSNIATVISASSTMAFFALATIEVCAQELTVDDVIHIWSERESATKTTAFHWIETVTVRGDLKRADLSGVGTKKLDCILQVGDDANMRFESFPVKNPPEPGVSLTRTGLKASAFNGKRSTYYTAAMDSKDHHRGIEFDAEIYDEIVNYQLRPVILCYRPLLVVQSQFSSVESRIVRHETKLRIIDRDVTLNGTPCLLIESSSVTPTDAVTHYWVDVARHGLILKWVETVSGRPSVEMTISYKDDALNGWVPTSWHGRFLNNSIGSSVIDFTVNKEIASDNFGFAYPAQTVVFDRDLSKQWRVLTGGAKEILTPDDQGDRTSVCP